MAGGTHASRLLQRSFSSIPALNSGCTTWQQLARKNALSVVAVSNPVGYAGRVPENGYDLKVGIGALVAGHYKLEAVGNHAAFVDQARRVAVGGYCYFNVTEANILKALIGSHIVRR